MLIVGVIALENYSRQWLCNKGNRSIARQINSLGASHRFHAACRSPPLLACVRRKNSRLETKRKLQIRFHDFELIYTQFSRWRAVGFETSGNLPTHPRLNHNLRSNKRLISCAGKGEIRILSLQRDWQEISQRRVKAVWDDRAESKILFGGKVGQLASIPRADKIREMCKQKEVSPLPEKDFLNIFIITIA